MAAARALIAGCLCHLANQRYAAVRMQRQNVILVFQQYNAVFRHLAGKRVVFLCRIGYFANLTALLRKLCHPLGAVRHIGFRQNAILDGFCSGLFAVGAAARHH